MPDSIYQKSSPILIEDNIVLCEGRLSIREDEPIKIVANSLKEFNEEDIAREQKTTKLNTPKSLYIDITDLDENQKERLRSAIRYFSGSKANIELKIVENGKIKPCRAILFNEKIRKIFEGIASQNNVELK